MTDKEKLDMAIEDIKKYCSWRRTNLRDMRAYLGKVDIKRNTLKIQALTYAVKVLGKVRREE